MSRNFQWTMIFGAVCLVPCLAFGADDMSRDRDPTTPSSRMLERIEASMRNTVSPAVPLESRPREVTTAIMQLPEIRIKAIVLSDDDNGSAILTANGRNVSVKLHRAKSRPLSNGPSRSQSGFTVGSVMFTVEDFSENSIQLRLSSDNSVMIIQ